MRIHIDPEAGRERLKRPVVVSFSCHAGFLAVSMLWSFVFDEPVFQFGDVMGSKGGAVAVSVVDGIPIPGRRSRPNPVANPTRHDVPKPQEKPKPTAPKPAPEDDPEALPIESPKRATASKRQEPVQAQRSAPKKTDNQLASSTGAAASSPIFSGAQKGSGGVGFGSGTPFGQGYAWYADAIQRKLGDEWRKTLGQAAGISAKPVVITFRIHRNGRIDMPRVAQTSGNRSVDSSALRAVINANPFPRLPVGLRKSSVTVEMHFQLGS